MVEESRRVKKNSIKTILFKILKVLFVLLFIGIIVFGLSLFVDGLNELLSELRDLMSTEQLKLIGEKMEFTSSFTMGTKLVIGALTILIIIISFFLALIKKIFNIIFK
ncbi:hypothetical protein BKX95_09895 [Streptococcus iniae]|uniref:hypothetical protein n=1 Tax=Streptococcus parauberis TaxID=1348 RepID=UPI0008D9A671|nr:hypothetical protein BKX95_09895 [Streptococcus iniae]